MDFKKIMQAIGSFLKKVWLVIKPYLSRFHQWRKRIWKKYQINKIIIAAGLLVVIVSSVYLFYLAKTAKVSTLEEGLKQTTILYDTKGQEAGSFKGQKGSYKQLNEISQNLIDAVISTEDRRFYQHKGYDIKGIARAAFRAVIRGNTSGGGGSTITQQLAKNAYLTQEQTFDRKARELFLAIEIEKEYSKDEILTMYLNTSYFGNGVWGVEDASHRYFAKSAAELTLSEAATIAGMLKGPNLYNPKDHYDDAINRRNTVLGVMVDNEKITQEQATAAEGEQLAVNDNFQDSNTENKYPYFFDEVVREASEKAKIDSEDLLNKGYKIYTTLNQDYQTVMQNTFNAENLFPEKAPDGTLVQGGSVAIDPKTGAVNAIVGGRGEHSFLDFNRGTQASVQPGSTMKPIAVYTPALEAGWKPDSILKDEALSFYDVKNYDGVYRGDVPMYQALYESLNASAVWLTNEIGLEKSIKKVKKFGIPLDKNDEYYGMVLGGLTKGVSPLTMAEAYTVFANEGVKSEAYFITKIVDASGSIIYEHDKPKQTDVTTKEVADQMTSMMQSVFSTGTGVNAKPDNFTMAGKTGSTETSLEASATKDQWIVGYTPDVVISTWIGFDESGDGHFLEGSSSTGVARIFKDEANGILAASPQTPFGVGDASQPSESTDSGDSSSWFDDFGQKVQDGADYWGGKIKEGIDGIWSKIQGN